MLRSDEGMLIPGATLRNLGTGVYDDKVNNSGAIRAKGEIFYSDTGLLSPTALLAAGSVAGATTPPL